jgi:hypothetical protein
MPLYATGFETASLDLFGVDGWTILNGSLGGGNYRHSLNGAGGNVSLKSTDSQINLGTVNGRWVNFWMRRAVAAPTSLCFVEFYRNRTTVEFSIRFETNGTITLHRGAYSGSLVATSAGTVNYAVGHWISIYLYAANTSGVCTVKVDGTQMVTFSGDTQQTDTTYGSNWDLVRFYEATYWYLDDVVVTDGTEGEITECYGILHVPRAAGDSTAWTPESGSNWENVWSPVDTDSYVDAAAASLDDLYHLTNPAYITSVKFVNVLALTSSQKDQTVKVLLKSGSTTGASSTALPGGDNDFAFVNTFWTTNPATSNPFTEDEIRSLQIGLRT